MVRVTLDNDTSVVSTHSRPEAAGASPGDIIARGQVSTHSRPEAAGMMASGALGETGTFQLTAARRRLGRLYSEMQYVHKFQLTAARRRLGSQLCTMRPLLKRFQLTAARRRLGWKAGLYTRHICFNSQPPGGGWKLAELCGQYLHKGFNSQPPGGGWLPPWLNRLALVQFQLTAARRRLDQVRLAVQVKSLFQLTAARRRLAGAASSGVASRTVSTHSRPEAAGGSGVITPGPLFVSTHSRPEAAGLFRHPW